MQLEDYEPDLDEEEVKQQELLRVEQQSSQTARIEAQKQQHRIMKKRKKNMVSFKYNIKLARIPPKKDWGSWLSSMFG